jgi:hypothetical protein
MSKRGRASDGDSQTPETKRRRRRRVLVLGVGTVAIEAAAAALRGYRPGGNVVVRCRDGHLFTTIWVPGASLKAIRLGPWRVQRCPVGHHWSLVTPARRAELTPAEADAAAQTHDIRLP